MQEGDKDPIWELAMRPLSLYSWRFNPSYLIKQLIFKIFSADYAKGTQNWQLAQVFKYAKHTF